MTLLAIFVAIYYKTIYAHCDDCGILVFITLRILARCVPFVFSNITLGAIIVCECIVRRAMTPFITMYRWADNLPNILVKGIYHDLFS